MILFLFLLWRIFDFLIIFFSQKVIPYLGFFPYGDQLPGFNLPTWISSLANFDGLHYVLIAKNGYSQFEQAFFPFYPLIIKFLTPLFSNNQLLTGLIISNIAFLIGITIFARSYKDSNWFIIFLLAFPTSFFFGAVYTEGLFFLLLISTLYFLKKERYLFVIIFAFLASLTRFVGIFLIIPIILHWIFRSFPRRWESRLSWIPSFEGMTPKLFLTLLAPILGLLVYCSYLLKTTGDPFLFLTSQPIFGANRSSHLIFLPQVYWRYFKIFFTAAHDFRYYISLTEFLMFNFVFIVLILDLLKIINLKIKKLKSYKLQVISYDRLGLNLFSFANLILPTLTGTFSSIPRYSLFSLSFFIYLSQIKNHFIKYLIVGVFIILHILLLGFFSQGYFIS
ncbi:MAG: hypothetical protein AAB437_01135 [Patescibacteria group bacterium]